MRYILLFGLLILTSLVVAQERNIKTLSNAKKHKIAKELNSSGGYYEAISHVKELLEKDSTNKEYLYTLAEAYFLSRDYVNAELYFKKVVDLDGKDVSLALFKYAESLKYNAKYKEAQESFDAFQKSKYKDAKGEKYKLFAKNEVSSCEFAIAALHDSAETAIVHLGDNINSGYTEFSPRPENDTSLIFASLQSDSVLTVGHGEMHYHHVKLYRSNNNGSEWEQPTEIKDLNTDYESNANGMFSPDGKRFYFTRCQQNRKAEMICDIYVSIYENGLYQKPQKLDDNVNIEGFTSTQPYIYEFQDGKTKSEMMFFASNRPGGKGGMDIWSCSIQNGKCKKPTNMGPIVNSIRDEMSPFYDVAYGCIYFSSNYHHGFGGYDIFRSLGKPGKWEKPVNIGIPFNTRVDDTYFILKRDKREGYLVSNRPGGIHLTSETCCDDIYSFVYDKPLLFALNPLDEKTQKKIDITNVIVLSRQLEEGENDSMNIFLPDSAQGYIAIQRDYIMKLLLAQVSDSGQEQFTALSSIVQQPISGPDSINLAAQRVKQINDSLTELRAKNYKYDTIKAYHDNIYNDLTQKQNPQSIYNLEPNREYKITVVVPNSDTVHVVFYTDKENNVHMKEMSSKVSKEEVDNENIKILSLKMLMNNSSNTKQLASKALKNESEKVAEKTKTQEVNLSEFTITKVIEEKESNKVKKGMELKVILNYDFDDVSFFEVNHGSLDSLVYLLNKYPELKINVDAHTDNKGSEKYNMKLSERRASSIKKYLNEKGIADDRMKSKGFGEKIPIAPNENEDGSDNPEGRQMNRRAEIIILDYSSPKQASSKTGKSKK